MNNNQTALGMSIQRKKDRLKQLMDSGNSGNINYSGRIRELEFQITEDEKLLAVEMEQIIDAHGEGMSTVGNYHNEVWPNDHSYQYYAFKYGTDGK